MAGTSLGGTFSLSAINDFYIETVYYVLCPACGDSVFLLVC